MDLKRLIELKGMIEILNLYELYLYKMHSGYQYVITLIINPNLGYSL
jgi:hypothetical protein